MLFFFLFFFRRRRHRRKQMPQNTTENHVPFLAAACFSERVAFHRRAALSDRVETCEVQEAASALRRCAARFGRGVEVRRRQRRRRSPGMPCSITFISTPCTLLGFIALNTKREATQGHKTPSPTGALAPYERSRRRAARRASVIHIYINLPLPESGLHYLAMETL